MTLVLLKPEIDQWQPGQHSGTFRGNNLAFVTATEALRFWETEEFSRSIERKGHLLSERLRTIRDRYPDLRARIRGRGLIQGLEIADAQLAKAIARKSFDHGLIIELCGNNNSVIKFLPPLTIEVPVLEQGLDLIEDGIVAVLRAGGG